MNLVQPRIERVLKYRDDTPRKAGKIISGYELHHWDGRIDAVAGAPPAHLTVVSGDRMLTKEEIRDLRKEHQDALIRGVRGGAFHANSGWYAANMLDVFDATQSAFAFLADTVKMALYTNAIGTMSYYTDTSQGAAPYNANEASGTGYTAGGYTLANKTVTQSPNGTVMFDNTVDPNWSITGSFATAVRGAVVHDTTLTTWLVLAIQFGSDYNVTNGTFTVQLNSAGLGTILFAS